MTKLQELTVAWKVRGLAILDRRLYAGYYEHCEIEEFEMKTCLEFSSLGLIRIPKLGGVADLTSCSKNSCVYVADWKNHGVIHRLEKENENRITRWSVDDYIDGISVTSSSGNVLVTCSDSASIKEFTTEGHLVREVKLQSGVDHPHHAIQLNADQFVVCHGLAKGSRNRVCLVNSSGQVLGSYYGCTRNRGSADAAATEQLNFPSRLAVRKGLIVVVDHYNDRILVLNRKLDLLCSDLLPSCNRPWRLCLHENSNVIVVSQIDETKITIYSPVSHWAPFGFSNKSISSSGSEV